MIAPPSCTIQTMLKAISLALATVLIASCAGDRAAAYRARQIGYHHKCMEYGFAAGSPDYGHCRQRFDEMEHSGNIARRAVVTQHLLQRTYIQQRRRAYNPYR